MLGDLRTAEPRARRFVGELGVTVVSVDYRLVPERRFTGALERSGIG